MMKETTLAYIAGLFDGEGSVVINKYYRTDKKGKTSGLRYKLFIKIVNTNEEVINYVHSVFWRGNVGGNKIHPKNWKHWFTWTVNANDAAKILKMLLPYLIIKKEHAKIAIGFQEMLNRQAASGKRCYLKNPLTVEEYAEREKWKVLLNQKNKKGPP